MVLAVRYQRYDVHLKHNQLYPFHCHLRITNKSVKFEIRPFCFLFALVYEQTFIKMRYIESRFVTRPEKNFFYVCACTIQPGNLTGRGSERVHGRMSQGGPGTEQNTAKF